MVQELSMAHHPTPDHPAHPCSTRADERRNEGQLLRRQHPRGTSTSALSRALVGELSRKPDEFGDTVLSEGIRPIFAADGGQMSNQSAKFGNGNGRRHCL